MGFSRQFKYSQMGCRASNYHVVWLVVIIFGVVWSNAVSYELFLLNYFDLSNSTDTTLTFIYLITT